MGLPTPTLATVFEVVVAGKIYHVSGSSASALDCRQANFVGMGLRATCSASGQDSSNIRAAQHTGRASRSPGSSLQFLQRGSVYPEPKRVGHLHASRGQ